MFTSCFFTKCLSLMFRFLKVFRLFKMYVLETCSIQAYTCSHTSNDCN